MLLDLLHRHFPEPRRAGQVTLKPAFLLREEFMQPRVIQLIRNKYGEGI